MENNMILQFRDGIFSLNTTRFGTVAEIMIKKLYDFQWSNTNAYDLFDSEKNARIEVKFSRATKSNPETIREENVIEQCLSAVFSENRTFNIDETNVVIFDSNIQQVKCRNFEYLFYGLFYADRIEIYGVDSQSIQNIPGYSDFQHEGNIGEGQFHLNNKTIDFHREHYFKQELTYEELFNILNV